MPSFGECGHNLLLRLFFELFDRLRLIEGGEVCDSDGFKCKLFGSSVTYEGTLRREPLQPDSYIGICDEELT